MSQTISCDVHGERACAIVCVHIVETLKDSEPRGFHWSLDEDGEHQATCSSCSDMDDSIWETLEVELGRVLCFECYCRAATLNGVSMPRAN